MSTLNRIPFLTVSCGCGWENLISLDRTNEDEARCDLTQRAAKHDANVAAGRALNPRRHRWHRDHPDVGSPSIFRSVVVTCPCGYRSEPNATADELDECINEHVNTKTHQEFVKAKRLASDVAKAFRD